MGPEVDTTLAEGLLCDIDSLSTNEYFPGFLIVRYRQGVDMVAAESLLDSVGVTQVDAMKALPIARLKVNSGNDISVAATALADSALIQYVEPDYRCKLFETPARLIPDDTDFNELWGMHNVGQNGGTADNDIDAPEAWNITQGSTNVIIAVCDTGMELNHDDLVGNLWTNPNEIPGDGIDNDGNGYTDDVHGVNFAWQEFGYTNTVPNDDHGHGTHVSGTIGGVGNNSNGVVGVNWNCRIMALKIGGGAGVSPFAAAQAIEYAITNGARVSNHSWGGPTQSAAMHDAIVYAEAHNHLVICAAGNDGSDNDAVASFPCNDTTPNVISVAAADRNGKLASFSNYGATMVDLAAPGVDIFSSVPSNYVGHAASKYALMSGTSMATPHVVGVAGLLLAYAPDAPYDMIKEALLRGTVKSSVFAGKVSTGGHLNAYLALRQLGALWMEFDPDHFNLAPNGIQTVNVTFNAGGLLSSGLYQSDIVLESGVTVSNRIPVTLTVDPGPVPQIESIRIDDSVGGDGDGFAEPGETVDIYVTLHNVGTYSQPEAAGTISTTASGVTVNTADQSWDVVYSDSIKESKVASGVTFGGGVTSSVTFNLTVDDGVNGAWNDLSFTLEIVPRYGILGSVTRRSDGSGVAGAKVEYFGGATGFVLTDAAGNYSINGVVSGGYSVRASAVGYGRSSISRAVLAGADATAQLVLQDSEIALTPEVLEYRLPVGRTESDSTAAANSGAGAWDAEAFEIKALRAAIISDGTVLTGFEDMVRAMGMSCDSYTNNEAVGYTISPAFLAKYDLVVTDLNGADGTGRGVTALESLTLSSYVDDGGHLIMSGHNPMSAASESTLGGLLGSEVGGVMSVDVTEGEVQQYSLGNALFDGPFSTVEIGDMLPLTPATYDYATADTNSAISLLKAGKGDKITYRQSGSGDVLYWAGNASFGEWTSVGVLQDLIRNYMLALERDDVAWVECAFADPLSIGGGDTSNLTINVIAPQGIADAGSRSAGILFVGNSIGADMNALLLNADFAKSASFTAMSAAGVTRWDGSYLEGSGSEDSSIIQLIYAGPDGTNSPAGTDGGASGDDVILMTFDTEIAYARVGDGFELAPQDQGVFSRAFGHDLPAGAKLFVRAWDASTFQEAAAWGDSGLCSIQSLAVETNDFGAWVVGSTIDYPGPDLADLRDQNGDGIPDGWNVIFRGDPRQPIGPLTPEVTVESEIYSGLDNPGHMAVCSNWVFVADTDNSRVVVLDRELGSVVTTYGSYGSGDANLMSPRGLDVNPIPAASNKLSLAVADTGNHRVVLLKFDTDNQTLAFTGKFGSEGSADGSFKDPVDVALSESGLYVADSQEAGNETLCNHRVQRFSTTGVWEKTYTGFLRPMGVSVDAFGLIYVADTGNNRVICLSRSGNEMWKMESGGSVTFNWPTDIHVGRTGWIYITDCRNNRLVILDASDHPAKPVRFAGAYGTIGSDQGELRFPWGLAAAGISNMFYVADSGNDRVQLVSFVVDSDGDGMEDLWEDEMGLDPSDPNDAMVDTDGDGLGALAEFRIGTNPNLRDTDNDGLSDGYSVANAMDPAGPFVPHTGIHIDAAGQIPKDVLQWNIETGEVYKVEMALDLMQPEWFVQQVITGEVAGVYSWTNSVIPADPNYFYRVRRED